jgi:hypothetical protein
MRYASCFFSLGLALAAGCVADPVPYYQVRRTEPGGLSTDEIVKLAKAGTSDAIIIEKINSTGVAVKPTAEQLADLKKEGVSDAVLNAMTTASRPSTNTRTRILITITGTPTTTATAPIGPVGTGTATPITGIVTTTIPVTITPRPILREGTPSERTVTEGRGGPDDGPFGFILLGPRHLETGPISEVAGSNSIPLETD